MAVTMRRLIWLTPLLWCTHAWSLPAFVQACNGSVGSTSITCTFGSNVTAGNTIVVMAAGFPTTTTFTVTDGESNCGAAYSAAGVKMVSTLAGQMFYCQNIAGGTTNVMTLACASGTVCEIVATEISGVSTTSFDKTAQQVQASTTTPTSGNTPTTSTANEILIGGLTVPIGAGSETVAAGTGFTIGTNQSLNDTACGCQNVMEYQVVSSTGAYAANYTMSGAAVAAGTVVATFQAPGGGGGTSAHSATFPKTVRFPKTAVF